jgi:predicted DNA-binding ArsR family transcriptional regulator
MSTSTRVKRDTYDTYKFKLTAYVAVKKLRDALDETKMIGCCTQSEYNAHVASRSRDAAVVAAKKLFEDNEALSGTSSIGQSSMVGINAICKTMSDEFPLGRVCDTLKALSLVNKLNDFTAEIKLESEVRKVLFKGANDYHTEVTNLLAQFDCTMSDVTLLKDMATKTKNTTYVQMIYEELKKGNPNFQAACLAIHRLQRMVNNFCKRPTDNRPKSQVRIKGNYV